MNSKRYQRQILLNCCQIDKTYIVMLNKPKAAVIIPAFLTSWPAFLGKTYFICSEWSREIPRKVGERYILRTWWNTFENFETLTVSEVCPYVTTYNIKIGFSSAFRNHGSQTHRIPITVKYSLIELHSLKCIHQFAFNIRFYGSWLKIMFSWLKVMASMHHSASCKLLICKILLLTMRWEVGDRLCLYASLHSSIHFEICHLSRMSS